MSDKGPLSERVLILAPSGRDAKIATLLLQAASFEGEVSETLAGMCKEIELGAGAAIISDEAILNKDLREIVAVLERQPPWSDFPFILMTQSGGGPERNPAASRLAGILGNVSFIERPFHPTTLASVVRTALRGRRRQYEARARLQELREGEQRLQTALSAGQLGSWMLDVETMELHASESCQSHFGIPPGSPFSYEALCNAVHPNDLSRMREAVEQTLRTGEDYRIEYRNVWQDGTVHWVYVRARALMNAAGKVHRLVGVSSDITPRKTFELERERLLIELAAERAALSDLTASLEQRVEERTAQLLAEVARRENAQEQLLQSQKMEVIGQLTGGVAHDFNNLLMAVMGNLDLLRKRVTNDPRAQRLIDGAIQGAQRGASLTKRMLTFARQQELETSSADMVALVTGMRDLLERSLGPRIALELRLPQQLPPAQVDAGQIELAILNLAINARDAMPDGGTITISLSEEQKRTEKLRNGRFIRLQVSDTGTGMDEATLKKAVEPFFSTKPTGKGTGLGLSMVHGLAVQLGGLLELSSKVGTGTSATLLLPVATSPSKIAEDAQTPDNAPVSTATILFVDDDPLIAMSTVDMLEDLGHIVIEAKSAKRALEILEGGQAVDLLITDQAMPGMTGVELAEIVHRKRPNVPVLLATGYAELPPGQKAKLPRLAKPYSQAQLQAEITRLLATR